MREVVAGVYRIVCVSNGRFYIGSSNDITRRWWEHRSSLNRGKHWNPYFQNAWNKYGESRFDFEIAEICTQEDRLIKEQEWIDRTHSSDPKIGFNLLGVVNDLTEHNCKSYIITKPDGSEEKIRNLRNYCKRNDLNSGAMSQVSQGNVNQHKGYKCRPATMTSDEWEKSKKRHWKSGGAGWKGRWEIVHPNGEKEVVDSLTDFCKNHGLSQGNMTEVAKGKRKQHRGYRCKTVGEAT